LKKRLGVLGVALGHVEFRKAIKGGGYLRVLGGQFLLGVRQGVTGYLDPLVISTPRVGGLNVGIQLLELFHYRGLSFGRACRAGFEQDCQ